MKLVSFLFADMPRPKRIKNLLKLVLGTSKDQHITSSSQHSVLQATYEQPIHEPVQPRQQPAQPIHEPAQPRQQLAQSRQQPA